MSTVLDGIVTATSAQWSALTIPLAKYQMVYETDTQSFKIGDGVTTYSSLPYVIIPNSDPALQTSLNSEITRATTAEGSLQTSINSVTTALTGKQGTIAAGTSIILGAPSTAGGAPVQYSLGPNISLSGTTLNIVSEVSSFNGRNGVITLTAADVDTALGFTPATAGAVTTETTRATGVEGSLQSSITALSGSLSSEITRATTAEATKQGTIASGTSILLGAPGTAGGAPIPYSLGTNLAFSGTTINAVGAVSSFNTRTGAITLSATDVNTALGFTPATAGALTTETTRATTAEGTLQTSITALSGSLSSEISTALHKANNLSDLASVPTALTNLGANAANGPILSDANNRISGKTFSQNITSYYNLAQLQAATPGALSGNYYALLLYGTTINDGLGGVFVLNNAATVDSISVFADASSNKWQRQNKNVPSSIYDILITATTATTVLSYTPIGNQNVEIKVYYRVVTAATNIAVTVTYTNNGGTSQTLTLANYPAMPIGDYTLPVQIVNASSTSAVSIVVTAGTANQVYVSATLQPF